MNKPTQKTSVAREKILKTALHLFYAQGIRATGIDLIIHNSQVAKMTFYKHFPSKQSLVLEVLRLGQELWLKGFHEVVDGHLDPEKRVLAAFDFLAKWFKDPKFRGCAYINATAESVDRETEECVYASGHKKGLLKFFESNAREMPLADKTAKFLAKQLLLIFDGAIVRAMLEKSPQPAVTAKSIAEILLALSKK